jgi:hypothetical protein
MRNTLFTLVILVAPTWGTLSCSSTEDAKASGTEAPSTTERAANEKVYLDLKPSCEGCHSSGSRAYFTSLKAFETLLVYDGKYVVAGDPEGSELVKLLEGTSSLGGGKMPTTGEPFAKSAGTQRMENIRAWIKNLRAASKPVAANPNLNTLRRLSAEKIRSSLYAQLGLTWDDFFTPLMTYDVVSLGLDKNEGNYAIGSADDPLRPGSDLQVRRFTALGGADRFGALRQDSSPSSPNFVNMLTNVSQAWCRLALAKQDNTQLFSSGIPAKSDKVETSKVIARWFTHFHATKPQAERVSDVYDFVFQPLETETDTTTAYVGVCSYMIRHPQWTFY